MRRGADDERRILVIANETVGGEALREMIREKSEGFRESVLVVTPALNSPLRHWASDEDGARAAAGQRLERSLVAAPRARRRGARRGRRLRAAAGDRGLCADLRPGRDHHLDAPGGPLALARERRRARGARAVRRPDHPRRRRSRGGARRGRLAPPGARLAPACVFADVLGDRVDLRLVQPVLEGGHRALAVRDAVDHEVDARLRVVEVRADRAGRPAAASVWQRRTLRPRRSRLRRCSRSPVRRRLRATGRPATDAT